MCTTRTVLFFFYRSLTQQWTSSTNPALSETSWFLLNFLHAGSENSGGGSERSGQRVSETQAALQELHPTARARVEPASVYSAIITSFLHSVSTEAGLAVEDWWCNNRQAKVQNIFRVGGRDVGEDCIISVLCFSHSFELNSPQKNTVLVVSSVVFMLVST